jgi:hypothetical protein
MSSAVERSHPPPRSKSCSKCKTAKRRCDLAVPACFRCSRRNLTCEYPASQAGVQEQGNSESMENFALEWPLISQNLTTTSVSPIGEQTTQLAQVPIADNTLEGLFPELDSNGNVCHETSDSFHNWGLVTSRTRPFIPSPRMVASRLQFALDELMKAPSKIVLENQTPWSHRFLYQDGMPRSMQGIEQH